jgi:hypothetical protein
MPNAATESMFAWKEKKKRRQEKELAWRTGRANAAVFPEPVLARPIISLPCRAYGIASRWMSVGALKLRLLHASHSCSFRPSEANVAGCVSPFPFSFWSLGGVGDRERDVDASGEDIDVGRRKEKNPNYPIVIFVDDLGFQLSISSVNR